MTDGICDYMVGAECIALVTGGLIFFVTRVVHNVLRWLFESLISTVYGFRHC